MSGILHKLHYFIKELKHITISSSKANQFEQCHDQLVLVAIKKLLKEVVKNKDDDVDVTFIEVNTILKSCQIICYNEDLKKIAAELLSYCNSVLTDRESILKTLLDCIHNSKGVSDVSILDVTKMNVKSLMPICKKMFSLEHLKADDLLLAFHKTELKQIYSLLSQTHFFSPDAFQSQMDWQFAQREQRWNELHLAKRSVRIPISTHINVRLAAIKGQTFMLPSSAPNSPVFKDETAAPITRMRALSAPKMSQKDYSTSSTVIDQNTMVASFKEMKLAPSSKSEDESDERRRQTKKQ